MHWIDWVIVILPLFLVAYIGLRTQRYVRGVADFLSAGRVAGRYVLSVAGAEAGMGLISMVGLFEMYYRSGLAYSFWGSISAPIGMIILLSGYCVYRFRETRAMTMGQFLEMRYNRPFRIYAGCIQSISGVLNYAIFPAVGARFLVYFCDLPQTVNFMGGELPTFMLVMAIFLTLAVCVSCLGGQITIMTTDCIQGILSYPLYAIVVIFILSRFSWFQDIAPPLMAKPAGKSGLDPMDIMQLRDFNIFFVMVGIFQNIFNKMSWSGSQGYMTAARDAHEQKMAGVLGTWRTGFSMIMIVLLAVAAFGFLNGEKYDSEARAVYAELTDKAMADVTRGDEHRELRQQFSAYLESGEPSPQLAAYVALAEQQDAERKQEREAADARWRRESGQVDKAEKPETKPNEASATPPTTAKPDAPIETGVKVLQGYNLATDATVSSQSYKTYSKQMRVPIALRTMLPVGIAGVFCALCIFMLISTDTTYLHSWGSIIVQDVVLPVYGRPITPRQQLLLLRIAIVAVACFAFIFSSFFGQVDFVLMFFAITGAIWTAGAGAFIVGGLYWKRGTTAGAFLASVVGTTLAVGCIILQKTWEPTVFPWLEAHGLATSVAHWLETASGPFEPIIMWRMSATKFPINSQEVVFFTMSSSVFIYVTVSLLTCRKPFNMDRLLHRGKYRREGEEIVRRKLTFKTAMQKLVGIDSHYTTGDKVIAWSVFAYSFGWWFLTCFVGVLVWNAIAPWPTHWWPVYYFIIKVVAMGLVALISTVWFTWGGVRDMFHLFRDLDAKRTSELDNGTVVGHVSADDVAMVEAVEQTPPDETP